MRYKLTRIFGSALGLLLGFALVFPVLASAVDAPILATPPGLSLAELKITGSEFVMLQNNTGAKIDDLSSYWLYSFNKTNPLTAGVTSSSQQLPSGSLDNGQTVFLSADGGATCGAAITDDLSVSLTDSGGYLEVVKTELVGGLLTQTAGDAVSWSSGTNTASGMISNVPSNTSAPNGAWYRYQNSALPPPYLWQKADTDPANICQLKVSVSGGMVDGPSGVGSQLLPGLPPPATIISVPGSGAGGTTGIPASDIGLRAPVVNELLPNPASPQTDTNDEFIELYNPNNVTFDLGGFKLQTKSNNSSTRHTYTFPSGTTIAAHGFAAYPSSNISISLTNAGAQVWLLDPSGSTISQSDVYTAAKAGEAWALADGKWYWTDTPTPGAANVIKSSSGIGGSGIGNGVGTVLGTSTSGPANGSGLNTQKSNKPSSIHAGVLVGVGALAILYGVYEYRQDLANKIYKFKRNRTAGRKNR